MLSITSFRSCRSSELKDDVWCTRARFFRTKSPFLIGPGSGLTSGSCNIRNSRSSRSAISAITLCSFATSCSMRPMPGSSSCCAGLPRRDPRGVVAPPCDFGSIVAATSCVPISCSTCRISRRLSMPRRSTSAIKACTSTSCLAAVSSAARWWWSASICWFHLQPQSRPNQCVRRCPGHTQSRRRQRRDIRAGGRYGTANGTQNFDAHILRARETFPLAILMAATRTFSRVAFLRWINSVQLARPMLNFCRLL
jgi:hypothetical protein